MNRAFQIFLGAVFFTGHCRSGLFYLALVLEISIVPDNNISELGACLHRTVSISGHYHLQHEQRQKVCGRQNNRRVRISSNCVTDKGRINVYPKKIQIFSYSETTRYRNFFSTTFVTLKTSAELCTKRFSKSPESGRTYFRSCSA